MDSALEEGEKRGTLTQRRSGMNPQGLRRNVPKGLSVDLRSSRLYGREEREEKTRGVTGRVRQYYSRTGNKFSTTLSKSGNTTGKCGRRGKASVQRGDVRAEILEKEKSVRNEEVSFAKVLKSRNKKPKPARFGVDCRKDQPRGGFAGWGVAVNK